jgi:hypothetical protein
VVVLLLMCRVCSWSGHARLPGRRSSLPEWQQGLTHEHGMGALTQHAVVLCTLKCASNCLPAELDGWTVRISATQ